MPRIHLPLHYRNAAHRILAQAHILLAAAGQQATRLEDVLVQAAAGIEDAELLDGVPQSRRRAVKEAARCLLLCADTDHPARLTDTGLLGHLTALDQLPSAERTTLVAEAVLRTETCPVATLNLSHPTIPDPEPTLRRRATHRCPCACATGGFCGGCGHAGCTGRR
ncbi:hypothetical protein EOT10_03850 [Streptomyces antnestii]|uniref:Uncharacterized protein n=1 Tax=Streptomyces antnestii TaxID=2494256 RepID=A0A3S2XZ92_9ACTN|nr:hypothetical protein [Streptomyces sp. San01]RVU28987.1 hypothetical protein EOT10_03850 [Streptomyces sp. San01]